MSELNVREAQEARLRARDREWKAARVKARVAARARREEMLRCVEEGWRVGEVQGVLAVGQTSVSKDLARAREERVTT